MSLEVVSPTSGLTASVDCHWPSGMCSTKPRSTCTGPPKCIGIDCSWSAAVGMLTCSSSDCRVISVGRLTTRPRAPLSLCSQMNVSVLAKCGSTMLGMAIRKWCVRLIGSICAAFAPYSTERAPPAQSMRNSFAPERRSKNDEHRQKFQASEKHGDRAYPRLEIGEPGERRRRPHLMQSRTDIVERCAGGGKRGDG